MLPSIEKPKAFVAFLVKRRDYFVEVDHVDRVASYSKPFLQGSSCGNNVPGFKNCFEFPNSSELAMMALDIKANHVQVTF